jgi:hypothetical protein
MKRIAMAIVLCAACIGPVQEVKPQAKEPERPPAEAPRPAIISDDTSTVEYRGQAEGKSLLEVADPFGAQVEIHEGERLLSRDVAPMAVNVEVDHWYRVAARLPSGAVREKKVQARIGQVASVHFPDAPPTGPTAMAREEFKHLIDAIDREPGDAAKLAVLKTAAASSFFTTAMAGVLLEHIVHRESKLGVIPIVKDRILDKQNAYTLYQHFTYREDKAKVQEMLEH